MHRSTPGRSSRCTICLQNKRKRARMLRKSGYRQSPWESTRTMQVRCMFLPSTLLYVAPSSLAALVAGSDLLSVTLTESRPFTPCAKQRIRQFMQG